MLLRRRFNQQALLRVAQAGSADSTLEVQVADHLKEANVEPVAVL